ncbi:HAD-IA family hydrolase [Stutzerimonas kirkiae]|uniref:HAD family hydrolase n=1 Tax=Stutzerimonas kirkiae TaxID=2211392 RepID=A0A4Q9RAL0_9GAMM|nr:HAD-IA family hydrolase [Stutzerimonas kirkiae]TBU97752.1 HAD family hydrolase [Stutzerimonas kirkiae]TBV04897.1 HAD family hydrolase [Stutzerimonas kirkiae]TBV12033.1 HAD family hydrolase [Stutzerimonas kirkiae]TBV14958.1 HAD family hydrolase [Stutzerimonas kirkiae]
MSDYQLLIFDWDGTLANSIGRIVESVKVAAAGCDLPELDDAAIRGIIGLSLSRAITVLYPHVRDELRIEHFRKGYSQHYLALEEQPSALYDGVRESLLAFREHGYRLAVATGKRRLGLDRVLEGQGWQDFFDVTRAADETASKPDPLMVHEILSICDCHPSQALMVGDSVFDLQMAQNAGVDAVAVGYGAQPLDILRQHRPKLAIEHFSQLGEWLQTKALNGMNERVG